MLVIQNCSRSDPGHPAKCLVKALRANKEASVRGVSAAHVFDRTAGIQPTLHGHVRMDPALQHAAPIELQESGDQHLRRPIESLLEPSGPTQAFDDVTEASEDASRRKHVAVDVVVLVAQLQRVGDRIADRSDPQLQRAAVTNERADIERNEVVDRADGRIRRRKQAEVVFPLIDDGIEVVWRHNGVAVHERQIPVHLCQERNACALTCRLSHPWRQIQREVWIAAQADCIAFVRRCRDQLREDIDPRVDDIADDVRVIAAHILLLGECAVEEASRLKIELTDTDVIRQRSLAQRVDVRKFRVAAEQTIRERLDEASLELTVCTWPPERERREDVQVQPRIFARTPEELVNQMIGLAQAERGTQANASANAAQSGFNARFDVGEHRRPNGHDFFVPPPASISTACVRTRSCAHCPSVALWRL